MKGRVLEERREHEHGCAPCHRVACKAGAGRPRGHVRLPGAKTRRLGRGWASGGRRRTQGQVALDLLVGHREDLALCLKEGQLFPASEGAEVDLALFRRDPSGCQSGGPSGSPVTGWDAEGWC